MLKEPVLAAPSPAEASPTRSSPTPFQLWRPHLPYLGLLLVGSFFLITLALLNHRALGTGYDLGIYDQTVWNLSQGRIWHTTLVYETNGYYDHFEPILLFFVPLYWLWPDVRVLLITQSLALALGSLPIYLYTRQRLAPVSRHALPVALALTVAYLAYPALHHANLNDFHEVALLPPLLGFALYGLLSGRRRVMLVGLGLALLVKEDVAVTVLVFGLYIFAFVPPGFRRRDGFFLALFAVVWAGLVLYLFYPALTRGMPYPFVGRRYPWLGDSPESALTVLLTQPTVILPHLLQPPKLHFLVRLFGPLLFLPLLGWPVILLSFPILGYLMLSSYEPQWSVQSYYNPPLLPILFFALAEVFYRVQRRARALHPHWALTGLTAAILLGVGVAYRLDAPGPGSQLFEQARFQIDQEDQAAYTLMEAIPPEAPVSASWALLSHLSHREQIDTMLDRPTTPPDYLIYDQREGAQSAPIYPYAAPDHWPPIYHEYAIVDEQAPYRLLQRQRSVTLVPLGEPDPPPVPLSLAAYGWLDSPSVAEAPIVQPGQALRLMLAWRRTDRLDQRYVFFVHVLDAEGNRLTQNDQEPGQGRFPTIHWESWTQPQIVLDEQRLVLPAESAPGRYEIWVGSYERESGRRVPLGAAGQELLHLGTIQVGD